MSFPGDSSQLVTQEMSDIPLELNSKKQAAENEPTTNVTIKEEYKYDGIEHHYISYECIKQEDCRDNLEDSQQDPLAIEDIGIGNVKREYSLIDHIKQECSTDVLVERKNGDTQTVDLEELEVNCSVDNYISTASTCEDSKQLNTKCNEKKEASSILVFKKWTTLHMEDKEDTRNTECTLRKNVQVNRQKVVEKYDCPNCVKSFNSKNNLKQHTNTIHYNIKFECDDCKKVFARAEDLKSHVNIVHRGINMYECHDCHKIFTRAGSLKSHVNFVHKGIKNYKCAECHKMFSRSTDLKTHVNRVHKGIKNECHECLKTFSEPKSLKKHINVVHRCIEKYPCHVCQRNFSEARALKRHIISVHERIKKFECTECHKRFTLAKYVKQHMNIHWKV